MDKTLIYHGSRLVRLEDVDGVEIEHRCKNLTGLLTCIEDTLMFTTERDYFMDKTVSGVLINVDHTECIISTAKGQYIFDISKAKADA